jgi:hypothetical protein
MAMWIKYTKPGSEHRRKQGNLRTAKIILLPQWWALPIRGMRRHWFYNNKTTFDIKTKKRKKNKTKEKLKKKRS